MRRGQEQEVEPSKLGILGYDLPNFVLQRMGRFGKEEGRNQVAPRGVVLLYGFVYIRPRIDMDYGYLHIS